MFNKPIEEMDFKELRSAVLILYDAFEKQRRELADVLENLGMDNFSGVFKKELDGMSTRITVNEKGIKTAVSEAKEYADISLENYSTTEQTSEMISNEVGSLRSDVNGTFENYTTKEQTANEISSLVVQITEVDGKHEEKYAEVKQTADGLSVTLRDTQTKVSELETETGNIKITVSGMKGDIEANNEQIKANYEKAISIETNVETVINETIPNAEASAKEYADGAKAEAIEEAQRNTEEQVAIINEKFDTFYDNEFAVTAEGMQQNTSKIETITKTTQTLETTVADNKTELECKIEGAKQEATSEAKNFATDAEASAKEYADGAKAEAIEEAQRKIDAEIVAVKNDFSVTAEGLSNRVSGVEIKLDGVGDESVVEIIEETLKTAKGFTEEEVAAALKAAQEHADGLIGDLPDEVANVVELIVIAQEEQEKAIEEVKSKAEEFANSAENNAKSYADEVAEGLGVEQINSQIEYLDAELKSTKEGMSSFASKTEVSDLSLYLDGQIENAKNDAKEYADNQDIAAKEEIENKITVIENNYSEILQESNKIQMIVSKQSEIRNAITVTSEAEMTNTNAVYKICDYGSNGAVTGETFYCHDGSGWQKFSCDSIYSVFEQTSEGFSLKGNVSIDGDLVGGMISGVTITTTTDGIGDEVRLNSNNDSLELTYGSDNVIGRWSVKDGGATSLAAVNGAILYAEGKWIFTGNVDFFGASVTGLGVVPVFGE